MKTRLLILSLVSLLPAAFAFTMAPVARPLLKPTFRLLMSEEGSSLEKDIQQKLTFGQKIKSYFRPPDDGLTFRQRLSKMGLAVLLSYGWVSNMSYCVSVSAAWYISCKRTGLSPLAPGQWKGFLAVYAGFYVFNNIVRPVRATIAVAIGPQFDKWVLGWQTRFGVNKATAIAIQVFLFNVVMTLAGMCGGILLASTLAGVPVFAK